MDKNEKQKIRRLLNENLDTKKYEKTFNGFLMRMYRNMQSRVTGVQHKKAHLYLGKELMSREDFYFIAKNDIELKKLFNEWELSKYNRKLTPSIDRIKSELGYSKENIRFVTHSENSRNVNRVKR